MYDLVKLSNFVLVRNVGEKPITHEYMILFCGEPKDEKKAFLQLEKVILKHQKNTTNNDNGEGKK